MLIHIRSAGFVCRSSCQSRGNSAPPSARRDACGYCLRPLHFCCSFCLPMVPLFPSVEPVPVKSGSVIIILFLHFNARIISLLSVRSFGQNRRDFFMTIMTQMTIFLTPALSPQYRHNRHYRHGEIEEKANIPFPCKTVRGTRTARDWGAQTPTSAGGHKFIFGRQGETCSQQVLTTERKSKNE